MDDTYEDVSVTSTAADSSYSQDDDAFKTDYHTTTIDAGGHLLMISVMTFAGVILCVLLPIAVFVSKRMKKKKASMLLDDGGKAVTDEENLGKVRTSIYNVIRIDTQTTRLLGCSIPFTLSNLFVALCDCAILVLVSHYVGTEQVIAYAQVLMLLALVQELLKGPIYANPSVCARSIGEGNNFMAGQYVQLSVTLYLIFALPFAWFWHFNMYEVLTFFAWADKDIGQYAQDFTKLYVWSVVVDAIAEACMYLLEVTDHEIFTTCVRLSHVATNVICLLALVFGTSLQVTLHMVGLILLGTSLLFFIGLIIIAYHKGWINPFFDGLTKKLAVRSSTAVQNIFHVAIPLSIGSVLANAEWTILTFFAAYMGEAECAAWVLLGHIWHLFDAITYGAGDAAEIQVALHLGQARPDLAKLAAYKSLWLGMLGAVIALLVSTIFMPSVPALFTPNQVLQQMIGDTLPLIGISYLILAYCYICWYIVGGTGRYELANYIHFLVSLLVTLPLASVSAHILHFDLSGLCAAIAIGYVVVAGALSYVLFTLDWKKAGTDAISNSDVDTDCTNDDDDFTIVSDTDIDAEIVKKKRVTFSSRNEIVNFKPTRKETMTNLATLKSRRAKHVASKNILLFVVKPGPLGLTIASSQRNLKGTVITEVDPTSPLYKRVVPGDRIVAIDGFSVAKAPAPLVSRVLEYSEGFKQREIAILTFRKRAQTEELGASCVACYEADFDDDLDAEIEMDYVRYGQAV